MLAADCSTRVGGAAAGRGCYRREVHASRHITVWTIECELDGGDAIRTDRWDQPAIILVRTGRYGRRVNGRYSVVDSTQCYVQQAGEEELIEHLGGQGHRGTVFTLLPDTLPALWRVRSRLVATEFRTTPAVDLAHRLLLAECRRGGDSASIAEMGTALVAGLVAGWVRSPHPTHRRGTSAATRRIVDIARELMSIGSAPPSLRSVAAAASVSPEYLTRVFRQSTGLTLSQYRNRLRVRLGLEMLANGEDDLSRIAHDLGFADHSHFSRTIMAEVGLQPRALRSLLHSPIGDLKAAP